MCQMDTKCKVPCACVVDAAVCALSSAQLTTGLVLLSGPGCTEVVPVWRGRVIQAARQTGNECVYVCVCACMGRGSVIISPRSFEHWLLDSECVYV